MTSIKSQGNLVVSGKRKRIPKKRLYESDDETDSDAYRSSSVDEKTQGKGSDIQEESKMPSTLAPRKLSKRSHHSAVPSHYESELDRADTSQNGQADTSSERDMEDLTEDALTNGQGTEGNNADDEDGVDDDEDEDGSEADYPPEYELSELEKLRIEVRGLRDEIMLLRHQVCKELPKVHAIALKALGMPNNNSYYVPQSVARESEQPEHGSKQHNTRPKRGKKPTKVKPSNVVKKEGKDFNQRVQSETASGSSSAALSSTKSIKNERVPSSSPGRRQATQKSSQVEIHPGTGVFVDHEAWEKLKDIDQPTAFARRILPYIFSMETLLTSNLRGGKSTRDTSAEPKRPLDQGRVDAIYKAVITKFPNISYCDIGQAINGRLSSIRYREQKRQARLLMHRRNSPAK